MPFCGGFVQFQQLLGAKERPQTHAEPRERVRAAFLAVDHADCVSDDQTLVSKGRHRFAERTSRGDDVLDEAHQLARLESPLDAFGRAVFLGLTADDDERQIGRDRKSTRLNSSHPSISYAVFCLKKKNKTYSHFSPKKKKKKKKIKQK